MEEFLSFPQRGWLFSVRSAMGRHISTCCNAACLALADIRRRARLLPPDQAADLNRRRLAGDQAARTTLLHSILPFAVTLARRARGLRFDDALAAAMAGALRAVDRWDPAKGALTTVAKFSIGQRIIEERRAQPLIRRPVKASRFTAAAVGAGRVLSLSGGGTDRGGAIPGREPDPLDAAIASEQRAAPDRFEALLARLPAQSGRLLRLLFVGGRSHRQAAAELGLTIFQLRQLRAEALGKLRRMMESEKSSVAGPE